MRACSAEEERVSHVSLSLCPILNEGLNFDDLKEFLKITPEWTGFKGVRFHLALYPHTEALHTFVTCWDRVSTFEAYAEQAQGNDTIECERMERIRKMASCFDTSRLIFIVGLKRCVLWQRWPKTYPSDVGHADDFVVMDGNHRLTALALRERLDLTPRVEKITLGVWIGRQEC